MKEKSKSQMLARFYMGKEGWLGLPPAGLCGSGCLDILVLKYNGKCEELLWNKET